MKNNELAVQIASIGAELRSVTDLTSGREYMWSGDAKYWPRVSPVLFPVVGNYLDHKSIYKGKTYTLGQHGFARDMEFSLKEQTENCLRLVLTDTEETLKVYPFRFELEIVYVLNGRDLLVNWIVRNTNDAEMYFSIGAHPGFVCDLEKDTLYFETPDTTLTVEYLDGMCVGNEVKEMNLTDGILRLTPELFDSDALIIENDSISAVRLQHADGHGNVHVAFRTPAVGIWSPTGLHAPFVCIEPWYGRADRITSDKMLENRELGNRLGIGEVFDRSYTITFLA